MEKYSGDDFVSQPLLSSKSPNLLNLKLKKLNNINSENYSYSTIQQQNEENDSNITFLNFSCCSMKMPTAARQAFSFVVNLFGNASTSTAQIRSVFDVCFNKKKFFLSMICFNVQ